ncbi:MAG: fatty acid cis/trans isomerase, partial [Nannocystaceae bacterium]|nr:fatty acid cis/trans isomerase [Nannocystaceae bacterium]
MFDGDWELTRHDEYRPGSTNPFAYFAAIPAKVRYRFMMENSREMIDAMVRGSVCIGSGATFAIRDRFWVWFLDPDSDPSALEEVVGEDTHGPLPVAYTHLTLPTT